MRINKRSVIALVLCAATLFALCACGGKAKEVISDKGLSVSAFESKAKAFGLTIPNMSVH